MFRTEALHIIVRMVCAPALTVPFGLCCVSFAAPAYVHRSMVGPAEREYTSTDAILKV